MMDIQRQRLGFKQVKNMLARKLGYSADEALKQVLENELDETTGHRLSQMANVYAKRTGNSVYVTNRDLFYSKAQARELAVSFFRARWATEMEKKLQERKYYKTPGGGIVFIPKGEVTRFTEDGAVYTIRVDQTEYFWKYTEDIYCDIYQNIYDPYGELSLGSKPRYVRAAYRKFLDVKLRHRDAYMTTVIGNDSPEMMINYFDASSGMVMGFSGAYYDGKSFNEMNYPEVGTGESLVPLWGSGKSAYYDFQDGGYGWATFNAGMAISDLALVGYLGKGLGKATLKFGMKTGAKKYFGLGMSKSYGARAAQWKQIGLFENQVKHHWAISQKLMERYPWLKPIGNQPWNITGFKRQATHMRWGHGTSFGKAPAIPYWRIGYPMSSTPLWFKWGLTNRILDSSENMFRDD